MEQLNIFYGRTTSPFYTLAPSQLEPSNSFPSPNTTNHQTLQTKFISFLCLSWWLLLLVRWVGWGGGFWLSVPPLPTVLLLVGAQLVSLGTLWSQVLGNPGLACFEEGKTGRKWSLHHTKFPISLAQQDVCSCNLCLVDLTKAHETGPHSRT